MIEAALDRPAMLSQVPLNWLAVPLEAVLTGQPAEVAASEAQAHSTAYLAQRRVPVLAEALEVATPLPAATEPTRLRFAVYGHPAAGVLAAAEAFMQANPGIVVDVQAGGPAQSLAAAARNADCLIWERLPQSSDLPALLDLQPLIDVDATFPLASYPAAMLAPFAQDGERYGLPLAIDLPVLAYQPALLRQAGIITPTVDWTLADLAGAAAQLTHDPQYGFAVAGNSASWLFFVLSRAGVPVFEARGDAVVPTFTKIARKAQEL